MCLKCYEAWLEHVPYTNANDNLRNDWYGEVCISAENAQKTRSTRKSPPSVEFLLNMT